MMGASLLAAMTVLSDESDADGDDDAVMMGDVIDFGFRASIQ